MSELLFDIQKWFKYRIRKSYLDRQKVGHIYNHVTNHDKFLKSTHQNDQKLTSNTFYLAQADMEKDFGWGTLYNSEMMTFSFCRYSLFSGSFYNYFVVWREHTGYLNGNQASNNVRQDKILEFIVCNVIDRLFLTFT